MKKLKMAVMAFAAISSIGSAFAFSPAAKRNAVTYYAIQNGAGHFAWTSTQPRGLKCSSTSVNAICSITTSNVPTNDVVPAGHTADQTLYK
jgi:hypothetical protein